MKNGFTHTYITSSKLKHKVFFSNKKLFDFEVAIYYQIAFLDECDSVQFSQQDNKLDELISAAKAMVAEDLWILSNYLFFSTEQHACLFLKLVSEHFHIVEVDIKDRALFHTVASTYFEKLRLSEHNNNYLTEAKRSKTL